MKKYNPILRDSLPFLTAAAPGGFRIFVLVFSSLFMARESTTIFATEYTLVVFFVMVSGVGFSTILIKEMADNEGLSILLRYAMSSVLIGGGTTLLLIAVLSFIVPVPDLFFVVLLVLSTSLYQVFRNYLIYKREFSLLLVNECLIFLIFVLTVFLITNKNKALFAADVLGVLSLAYLLSCLFMVVLLVVMKREKLYLARTQFISWNKAVSCLVVGLSNAVSSGVNFLLPSLFASLGGGSIVLIASISAAVFSAMSALPRGVVNSNIGVLSRMVLNKSYCSDIVHAMRVSINRIVISLVPFLCVFIVAYFYLFGSVGNYLVLWFFVIVLGLNVASGQLGVVESVLINLCGYERLSLVFNSAVFLLVLFVFLFVKTIPFAAEWVWLIYSIPVTLGVINIFRMLWYRRLVMRYFEEI